MKNKLNQVILMFVLMLILSGCSQQHSNAEKFSKEDRESSLLNKVADYQFSGVNSLDLELQSVEIQLDKGLTGKAAFVYNKNFDDADVENRVKEAFIAYNQIEFEQVLIPIIEEVSEDLQRINGLIEVEFLQGDIETFKEILNENDSFLGQLKGTVSMGPDELLKALNHNKDIVERYLIETSATTIRPQENLLKSLKTKVEVLEILVKTYELAMQKADGYIGSGDYLSFYSEVVSYFNNQVLRHYNVNSQYDMLIDWVEEELIMEDESKHLYIIKESLHPEAIHNEIQGGAYEDYLTKETYQGLLDILNVKLEYYTDLYEEEQVRFNNYNTIKMSLEDIKGVKIQKAITSLNLTLQKLKTSLQDKDIQLAIDQMTTVFKELAKSEGNQVTFKTGKSNENEVFFLFSFDEITDLYHNIYINRVEGSLSDSLMQEELWDDIAILRAKYIGYHLGSPHVKSGLKVAEQVNKYTDIVRIIKAEMDAVALKNEFVSWARNLTRDYDKDVTTIQLRLEEALAQGSKNDVDLIEAIFRTEIEELNKTYQVIVEERLQQVIQGFEQLGDRTDVEEILELIGEYDKTLAKEIDKQKSIEKIVEEFNELYMAYFYFAEGVPYNIRMSVSGSIVNRLNNNGQPVIADSFQINGEPSGTKTVRLMQGQETAALLFKNAAIGKIEIIGFLSVLVIALVVMMFINRTLFRKTITLSLLIFVAMIVIYPVLWIIGSSFSATESLLSVGISPFPKNASFIQYERLFKTTEYVKWYWNTFKIAIVNMILSVAITTMVAFVLSRFKFKGKKFGLMTILILQIFPGFLGMVATYTLLSRITFLSAFTGTTSLINTHLGLILVYVAGQIPYNTWLTKGYFDTIPKSLDEAARIDGASNLRIFWQIVLPLGRPIIAFAAVTNFMSPWMDFIFPRLILLSQDKKTLALGLFEMINGRSDTAFTMFAAGAVLVAVPITCLFSYFQKYIVTGLAAGAVKE